MKRKDHSLGSTVPPDSEPALREWIIQRCTERWIGTELQYEEFPGYMRDGQWTRIVGDRRHPGRETRCSIRDLMTRDEMTVALEYCENHYPDNFKGHNVMSCRCDSHARFRSSTRTSDPDPASQPNSNTKEK